MIYKPRQNTSWRNRVIYQQPIYENKENLQTILDRLAKYPPLVFPYEIERLTSSLAKAAQGKAFLLQGGDCAESFDHCNSDVLTLKLRNLYQMAAVLSYGIEQPIITVGRIAGQYSKPRSKLFENFSGSKIPIFRGESINGLNPSLESRRNHPERLLEAIKYSALTLNFIRSYEQSSALDCFSNYFDFNSHRYASIFDKHHRLVENLQKTISLMSRQNSELPIWKCLGSIYTSHEGLILSFEEAMTRFVKSQGKLYNLSAHMLWIGDRTRQIDGGHIEYFKYISNPIGIKIGPSAEVDEIVETIKILNPGNKWGRITLIPRFGYPDVELHLPELIRKVQKARLRVLWSCDPMHGNNKILNCEKKTREFDHIVQELVRSREIHNNLGSYLGGVHLELTGEHVTECLGGPENISETDLSKNYQSLCDPRLNALQSLEIAFIMQESISNKTKKGFILSKGQKGLRLV